MLSEGRGVLGERGAGRLLRVNVKFDQGCEGSCQRRLLGTALSRLAHVLVVVDHLDGMHMQCMCSAHAVCTCSVQTQCTCSAHAVHMRCTCILGARRTREMRPCSRSSHVTAPWPALLVGSQPSTYVLACTTYTEPSAGLSATATGSKKIFSSCGMTCLGGG